MPSPCTTAAPCAPPAYSPSAQSTPKYTPNPGNPSAESKDRYEVYRSSIPSYVDEKLELKADKESSVYSSAKDGSTRSKRSLFGFMKRRGNSTNSSSGTSSPRLGSPWGLSHASGASATDAVVKPTRQAAPRPPILNRSFDAFRFFSP